MKRLILPLILLSIALTMFSGCSMSEKNSDAADENLKQEVNVGNQKDEGDKSSTPGDEAAKPANLKNDTGRYVGQIDSSSIEIKISGVPDEIAARAFRLTDDTASSFDKLKLQENEQVSIEYYVDEYDRNILVSISRLT